MMSNTTAAIHRRRSFLCGPAVKLLRQLARRELINTHVYVGRDGRTACLLGHLAATPLLRADGWHFVNGIPQWGGRMGVAAAAAYFGLEREQAFDVFGSGNESRACSLEQRFSLMETFVRRSMSNDLKLTG